jgi:hypothetical protein
MRSLAPVVGALAALALIPATAAAAPDRSGELAALDTTYEWSSDVKTGAVYTFDVAENVPPCTPIFSCDATLVKTAELGDLRIKIEGVGLGDQDTLSDVDLHVYASDEDGTQGDLVGEDTSADANEAVVYEDAPAGYYLVYVDWYLGVGSIDGTATLSTPVVEEDPDDDQGDL